MVGEGASKPSRLARLSKASFSAGVICTTNLAVALNASSLCTGYVHRNGGMVEGKLMDQILIDFQPIYYIKI
jgi:hypothetical protein